MTAIALLTGTATGTPSATPTFTTTAPIPGGTGAWLGKLSLSARAVRDSGLPAAP
jgi:hypothetical protein